MSADIIVFADAEALIAIDLSDGQHNVIGFDGRKKLRCEGASTIQKFSGYIVDYYNYEDISELSSRILLVDCGANQMVIKGFEQLNSIANTEIKVVSQDFVASKAYHILKAESSLKIDNYGLNFYGKHYFTAKDKLMREKFKLTGYCLEIDESIKYVKDEM